MDETRRALIVASDDYTDPGLLRLRAPAIDAQALAGVLRDPGIGGFEVRTLLNEPAHLINRAVEGLFADGRPGDLLLVHFSGHGVKDEDGELYFAAADTVLGRLDSTAVGAGFVSRRMNRSRSRRVVLLLDCCYAGAFERGLVARAGVEVGIEQQFRGGGRGRAVITASSAMGYAFEAGELADTREPSVFTSALVQGLQTGEADRDQDGQVGLDELYDYVYDRVRAATPNQTPGKWTFGVEGELYLARRSHPVTIPSPLPPELQQAIDNPFTGIRAGAVRELTVLLRGRHAGMELAARLALEQLTDDDSRVVAAAAAAALSSVDPGPLSGSETAAATRADPARETPADAGSNTHQNPAAASATADSVSPVRETAPAPPSPAAGRAVAGPNVGPAAPADGGVRGSPDGGVQPDPGPVRVDHPQTSRLLADATRLVQSLPEIGPKASALAALAQVLFHSDPEQSARLIADAERIAQSITEEHEKGWSLAEIAPALAALDPDQAERLAQSITDAEWQTSALVRLAQSLAASDPDRAARLVADAERAAQSIISDEQRVSALAEVAQAPASYDPERPARLIADAERVAQSITGDGQRVSALAKVAQVLLGSDPERAAQLIGDAERAAESITGDQQRVSALQEIAPVLAASDPDRAVRVAQSITDQWQKAPTLAAIANVLATSDPDRAMRLAHSIADAGQRASALADLAQALSRSNPERAARLITDAERIARSSNTDWDKALALTHIATIVLERRERTPSETGTAVT